MERIRTLAVVLALAGGLFAQSTSWTGSVSDDWGDAGNWSAGVPDAATDAVIGPAATSPDTDGFTAACRDLTVSGGGQLTITSGFDVSVQRNASTGGSVVGSGAVVMAGIGGIASGNFANLTITGTTTMGNATVTGDLQHLAGAGTLTVQSAQVTVNGNATLAGQNLFLVGSGGLTVGGDFTHTTSGTTTFPPNSVTVSGSWTSDASWQPTFGTAVLAGSGVQTVNNTGGWFSLTVNNGAQVQLTGDLIIGGDLNVAGTLEVGGTTVQCRTLTTALFTGNLQLPNATSVVTTQSMTLNGSTTFNAPQGLLDVGASLTISQPVTVTLGTGTHVVAENVAVSSVIVTDPSSVFRIPNAGQIVSGFFPNLRVEGTATLNGMTIFGDLVHAVGAGTLTIQSAQVNVNGNATLEGQNLLLVGSGGLTVVGDFTHTTSGTTTFPPNSVTVSGSWTSDASWQPTFGTAVLAGSGVQTVNNTGGWFSLAVNNGAQVQLPGDLIIAGDLSVAGSLEVTGSSLQCRTLSTISNAGNLQLPNATSVVTAQSMTLNGSTTFNAPQGLLDVGASLTISQPV